PWQTGRCLSSLFCLPLHENAGSPATCPPPSQAAWLRPRTPLLAAPLPPSLETRATRSFETMDAHSTSRVGDPGAGGAWEQGELSSATARSVRSGTPSSCPPAAALPPSPDRKARRTCEKRCWKRFWDLRKGLPWGTIRQI